MSRSSQWIISIAAFTVLLGPIPTLAQGVETVRRTVTFAGQMHGAESRCNDYDKAALGEMRRAQKTQAMAGGLSAEDFEAAWAVGYEDARQKMATLGDSERSAACNTLRAAAAMRPKP